MMLSKYVVSQKWGVWQYGLWSFQSFLGGKKLERCLPKNQRTKRKLLNYENWVNWKMKKSAKV